MRVAFFSPFPPAKSGIADYSATLLEELRKIADVSVYAEAGEVEPCDVALYQIGNNGYHAFCYEEAVRNPGVVVLHEANLHHLIAEMTIKRGDWDAYLREVEFDGGAAALKYAREYVATRKRGPDYEGVPMLRRVLAASRGLIVHSGWVEEAARAAGYKGPVARIPHGAWIPPVSGAAMRERLGVAAQTPLIGIFGFLKPYKRIAESLRAMARLVKRHGQARMILAGEVHPELHIDSLIASCGLGAHVRTLGFLPMEEFVEAIAACDIVLNLRHPTVGENSGTLMRALGLGKAVLVSDNGSFRELPDDVCLKVPVDASEEDVLFEFLDLLVTRADLARGMGKRARKWVERECSWPSVARKYALFLEQVVKGEAVGGVEAKVEEAAPAEEVKERPEPAQDPVEAWLLGWAQNDEKRAYMRQHITRLRKTLEITPGGGPGRRVLEMGAYLQITPALRYRLGYEEVRGCYYGEAGRTDRRTVRHESGQEFFCEVDLFDAERDVYPYADGYFSTVLCCELLEHLLSDPMHMMSEIHRILAPGGQLVLTTPNAASLRAIESILGGGHPGFFPAYLRPRPEGAVEARHNREYTPAEIRRLLEDSGFEVERLETGEFCDAPHPEFQWVMNLLERYQCPTELRGEDIFVVGRKAYPVRERYPAWLYQ
jgi:glycosyltransferase involved in cell wall biosynthesis/SAM-dependent methyltransferase